MSAPKPLAYNMTLQHPNGTYITSSLYTNLGKLWRDAAFMADSKCERVMVAPLDPKH